MLAKNIVAIVLIFIIATFSAGCSSSNPVPDEDISTPTRASMEPILHSVDEATQRTSPNGETSITWLAQGKNAYVGTISLTPGAIVPLHRHQSEEYLFIQQGGGVLTIEGVEKELRPGTIVAIPSNAEHGYVNGPEKTVAFQVFAEPGGEDRFLEWPETDADSIQDATSTDAAESAEDDE